MSDNKFDIIPATECILALGDFSIGDNGDSSKSAPVVITARSGQPFEHKFWGRMIHDFAGMKLVKARIPIDYCHNEKEIIGYANHFSAKTGDLVLGGALVPFKESDRATEIIYKMKNEVPYEASINFGGDGIKVQMLLAGQTANVNGIDHAGPLTIIREWPLRGVAVCPYGYDGNTDASLLSAQGKTFSATVASVTVPEKTPTEEETQMSQSVEVVATVAVVTEAIITTEEVKPIEEVVTEQAKPEEVVQAEAGEVVDAPAVETEMIIKEKEKELVCLSREEFSRISDRFGNDIAARCMKDGADFQTALSWHVESLESENADLKTQLSAFITPSVGKPVAKSAQVKPASTLLAMCDKGTKGRG